ncbi:MAG: T9SS type B sorting domain-containing protein [Flavobacteriaceae bacterium]|nr:T9SS type B sorting domain-containing protein [Flavobacteriaceae bacterium]
MILFFNKLSKTLTVIVFFLTLTLSAQNDCVDAIFICGNANLSGLTANGIGVQEISPGNACGLGENNSLWLKIKIRTGGTLGFTLTPQSSDLLEDLDFWIFGPNVTCNNLGTAIRCSTTNPLQASLTDNLTGINGSEIDISEGPGPDGNSFVKWIDVLDNETYYIAIDRPVGVSAFSITWSGTSTFFQAPTTISKTDFRKCSLPNFPGEAYFDMTPNSNLAIGSQTNIIATYYTSYNDAVTNTNAIANTNNFRNTSNPQQIFIRLSNTFTGCFAITDFNISVTLPTVTGFSYNSPICINDTNPIIIPATGFTIGGIFSSTTGLSINTSTGEINLTNSLPGTYQVNYTITANPVICQTASTFNFSITINPLPSIQLNTPLPSLCINGLINPIIFNISGLATNASISLGSLPAGLSGSYNNGVFTIIGKPTITGLFNFTITTQGGCSPAAIYNGTLIINSLPNVTLPQDGFICLDDAGNSLGSYTLIANLSSNNHSFVWSNSTGVIAGQTRNNYRATLPGAYSLVATNSATGCFASANAIIGTHLSPGIVTATVSNYFSEIQTVSILVSPIGIYEYKLDFNPYQDSNVFTNLSMGVHDIWVRDKFFCGVKKITFQIIDYPNYFTPNGDTIHDTWNITELKNQPNSYIDIFDRYGKLIRQINPSGQGWDGNYNGNPLPATDYWFTVYYTEQNINHQFSSHFSLVR